MTELLLDHLWQSTLFTAAAAFVALALHRNAAQVRYWVWFAAAAKFLVPFAVIASGAAWLAAHLHAQAPAPPRLELARRLLEPMTAPGAAHALLPHALLPLAPRSIGLAPPGLRIGLAAAWALGSVAVVWRRVTQWRRLNRALAGADVLAVPTALRALSARGRGGPAVVGFLRPVLVLPQGLAERLTPAELEAVLQHEQHHVRRRDNLLTLPLMLAQALFWFHPLIWWIGRRLLAERERACDEAVLQEGIDAETYARGLLEVCRLGLEPSPVLAAALAGTNLKRRIRRIMSDRPPRPLSAPGGLMLTAAMTAAIATPVLAGVYAAAPAAMARGLVQFVRPTAGPARQVAPSEERPAPAQTPLPKPARVILVSAPAVLAETVAYAPPEHPAIRLAHGAVAPTFQRAPAEPPPADYAPASSADPNLLRALADRTAYVPGVEAGAERLVLREAGACPTAGVMDAEQRLGGEVVSTAFDGRVRRFVDEAVAGKVSAPGLSPTMARAVDRALPALHSTLAARFGGPAAARLIGEDQQGRDVYLVRPGPAGYVLVLVDDLGQIEAAVFCTGG